MREIRTLGSVGGPPAGITGGGAYPDPRTTSYSLFIVTRRNLGGALLLGTNLMGLFFLWEG